jgi:hypothetical protein
MSAQGQGVKLDPKVRNRIRSTARRTKAKIAKHDPALLRMMEWVFEHGPIEQGRMEPDALKHPEFYDMFDEATLDGRPFFDLSGQGRYHMTGEHAAIDEKPWRPARPAALEQPQ